MGNLTFSESGWDDYLYWQTEDKKTLKRINQLVDIITMISKGGCDCGV